jgi:hypothetical protein
MATMCSAVVATAEPRSHPIGIFDMLERPSPAENIRIDHKPQEGLTVTAPSHPRLHNRKFTAPRCRGLARSVIVSDWVGRTDQAREAAAWAVQ